MEVLDEVLPVLREGSEGVRFTVLGREGRGVVVEHGRAMDLDWGSEAW
jgi:hypothetical protein